MAFFADWALGKYMEDSWTLIGALAVIFGFLIVNLAANKGLEGEGDRYASTTLDGTKRVESE